MERIFHQELPDTGKFSQQLQDATAQAPLVIVNSDEARQQAEELLSALKQMRKHPQIQQLESLKKEAHDHWKRISALIKQIVDPIDAAVKMVKAKILAYDMEQRRKQQQQAEALKEQMKKREIEAAIEAGDLERAKRVMTGEAPLPEIQTKTGPVGATTHHRGQWQAEITDPRAVLEEVLAGKVPLEEAVEIKLPYFNRLARRMRAENLGVRGVRGVYREVLVSR